MTLKNSLINTEKPTRILHCRIAWRSRCAICTLIFSIFILSGLNDCFAQEFNVVQDGSFYPTGSNQVIPPVGSSDMAVLKYTFSPYNSAVVIDADIIPSVTLVPGISSGGWGWFSEQRASEPTFRTWYSIISPDTLYVKDQYPPEYVLRSLQQFLVRKNLGTVVQRRNYINWLNNNVTTIVNPLDFRSFIQPWIIAGIVISILIPAWYLMRRFLRG